jgi:glycosyltransferase involved in cell wall biosynthesis
LFNKFEALKSNHVSFNISPTVSDVTLTVITPVYNNIPFTRACIENVIQQHCKEIEHLIIDGGSTDGTIEILEEYATRYSHIRFFSEKDRGQSDAMNKGIKMARGEFIGFLNADDGYFPFTLNRVVMLLKRYSKPVVLVGNCMLVNQQHQVRYINRPRRLQAYHFYSGTEPYPINPSAYFYSKAIHDHPEVAFYDENNHFNMDYDFFLKVCLHFPIIYFNEDWGFMLDHPEAKTTRDINENSLEDRKKKLFISSFKKAPMRVKVSSYIYCIKKKLIG